MGSQSAVVGTFALKQCTLAPNESIEFQTDRKEWIPGMIVGPSSDPIGYKVQYLVDKQAVIGTSTIKRCTLFPGESVEIWGGEAGWLPGEARVRVRDDEAGWLLVWLCGLLSPHAIREGGQT